MQGSLMDMSIADLIQHNCQDRKVAQLQVRRGDSVSEIYFANGNVVHAELHGQNGKTLSGEEVIFQVLGWDDGVFDLQANLASPQTTITRSWSGLLLEAAKRFDEQDQPEIQNSYVDQKEKEKMPAKKKGELLSEMLTELLEESSDIEGAAIVGTDGLVYSANVPQRALDENMVGAASAAVFGIAKRSLSQLKRGNYSQTLIQGDDGNIIVASLNELTLFIGLTPKNVNLGMAFAEVRSMTAKLREIL